MLRPSYERTEGITKCVTCPKHCKECDDIRDREIETAIKLRERNCITSHLKSDTLCWCCEYAMPEADCICPWTKEKKPVKDWNATQRVHDGNVSYKVHDCPLFKRGTVKWEIE